MSKIETVRYVSWPRDVVRTATSGDVRIEYLPMGVRFRRGRISTLIPWANVIDVEGIDTESEPVKRPALSKPKPKRVILPK